MTHNHSTQETTFAHVDNEADRQALIALFEKETALRTRVDEKDAKARNDPRMPAVTAAERAEIAKLMDAIKEISDRYDHLMPNIVDPFDHFYAGLNS